MSRDRAGRGSLGRRDRLLPEHNEVLAGQTRIDRWIEQGFVDLRSPVSGICCVGAVRTTRQTPNVSPPLDCDGAEGTIELECSDQRRLAGRWRSGKQCGAGYGFHLADGMSPETAALRTRESIAELANRPRLPAAGAERAVAALTPRGSRPSG